MSSLISFNSSGSMPFLALLAVLLFVIWIVTMWMIIKQKISDELSARDTKIANEFDAKINTIIIAEIGKIEHEISANLTAEINTKVASEISKIRARDNTFSNVASKFSEIEKVLEQNHNNFCTITSKFSEIEKILEQHHNNFCEISSKFTPINTSIEILQNGMAQRYAVIQRSDLGEHQDLGLFQAENFYNNIMNELLHLIYDLSIPELYPVDKQSITGRFRRKDVNLPINGSNIDMRMDTHITNIGKELLNEFQDNIGDFRMLFGVSGAGKTRTIFDIAMSTNGIYVMYIECVPPSDERQYSTKDRVFGELHSRMNEINLASADGQLEANRLVALHFVSRIIFLVLLLKKNPNLTSREYLLSQLNGGQDSTISIMTRLRFMNNEFLCIIFKEALNDLKKNLLINRKLTIAIDEANVAHKLFFGMFQSPNKNSRGILTPMLQFINKYSISMIVSGTAFTLHGPDTIQSDIGKTDQTRIFREYKPLTKKEIFEYVNHFLDLSDCVNRIDCFSLFEGRPRFAASLVEEIVKAEIEHGKNHTKQDVLQMALDNTIKLFRCRLEMRLDILVKDIFAHENTYAASKRMLGNLFLSCRFGAGNVFEYIKTDESLKLVDCGIAFIVGSTIKVIEPLSQEVVVSVLGKYYTKHTTPLLQHHYNDLVGVIRNDKTNQAKGLIWQHLIMSALIDTEKTVENFLRRFAGNTLLTSWATSALFKIDSVGKTGLLELKYNRIFRDEIEVLEAMVKGEIADFMLEPSNLMRPDGIYLKTLDYNKKEFFSIQVSCKILARNLSGNDLRADFRSTDFTKLYQKKDDTSSAAPHMQENLHNMLKSFNHIGSLRIHCTLPGISNTYEKCIVNGNDIILYIDKTNLAEFLGEKLGCSVLDLLEYR